MPRREPRTEAERRALEVKARTGGRRAKPAPKAPDHTIEQWIDEGAVADTPDDALRRAARDAARRAAAPGDRAARADRADRADEGRNGRRSGQLAEETVEAIERAVGARRGARLVDRLTDAAGAVDRERYGDARRIAASLMNEIGDVAAVHEVFGLASYRLGKWRDAVRSLEVARSHSASVQLLPVLADSYRALRKYHKVDELWRELREVSPAPEVMAEGRIVAAGAHADQGDLTGALRVMAPAAGAARRVREYHLKQWYVLGDLYDRAGDVVRARQFFARVVAADAGYADASDRLAALGR